MMKSHRLSIGVFLIERVTPETGSPSIAVKVEAVGAVHSRILSHKKRRMRQPTRSQERHSALSPSPPPY